MSHGFPQPPKNPYKSGILGTEYNAWYAGYSAAANGSGTGENKHHTFPFRAAYDAWNEGYHAYVAYKSELDQYH